MADPLARRIALSWARNPDLTPFRLWPALRERGGLDAFLACSEEELSPMLGGIARARAVRAAPHDREADVWAAGLEASGVRVVSAFDAEFPALLAEIPDPPFVLFAAGTLERLGQPAVAVVGSREATRYGRDVARELARELAAAGISVVSGFARGIDAAAHEGALPETGSTIAVLGCGLDVEYPRENERLREAVARRGLLVSEFLPGTEPRPQNFPIRNRVIAGLVWGVVVVEASHRSGSLITARLAADFGRDVFAVPGSVFSGTSTGTHELLRDGAILCRGAGDVFAELFPSRATPARAGADSREPDLPADLSADAKIVRETLRREEPASAEDLSRAAGLPAATVLAAIFELEAAGLIQDEDPGRYRLTGRHAKRESATGSAAGIRIRYEG